MLVVYSGDIGLPYAAAILLSLRLDHWSIAMTRTSLVHIRSLLLLLLRRLADSAFIL